MNQRCISRNLEWNYTPWVHPYMPHLAVIREGSMVAPKTFNLVKITILWQFFIPTGQQCILMKLKYGVEGYYCGGWLLNVSLGLGCSWSSCWFCSEWGVPGHCLWFSSFTVCFVTTESLWFVCLVWMDTCYVTDPCYTVSSLHAERLWRHHLVNYRQLLCVLKEWQRVAW